MDGKDQRRGGLVSGQIGVGLIQRAEGERQLGRPHGPGCQHLFGQQHTVPGDEIVGSFGQRSIPKADRIQSIALPGKGQEEIPIIGHGWIRAEKGGGGCQGSVTVYDDAFGAQQRHMTGLIRQPGPDDPFLTGGQSKGIPRCPSVRFRCPAGRQELPGDGDIPLVVSADAYGYGFFEEKIIGRGCGRAVRRFSGQRDASGRGDGVERQREILDRRAISGRIFRPYLQGIDPIPRKGEAGL